MSQRPSRHPISTKEELLDQLRMIIKSATWFAAVVGIADQDTVPEPTILRWHRADKTTIDIAVAPIRQELAATTGLLDAVRRYHERLMIRTLLRDPLEIVRYYAGTTGQDATMTSAPWYRFARVMRNCASHGDFALREWRYKAFTEAKWRGHVVNTSMLHQEIRFSLAEAFELANEIVTFSSEKLS
jgi:hypothetical protein